MGLAADVALVAVPAGLRGLRGLLGGRGEGALGPIGLRSDACELDLEVPAETFKCDSFDC